MNSTFALTISRLTIDVGGHGVHLTLGGRGVLIAREGQQPGEALFWRCRDAAGTTTRLGPFIIVIDAKAA